jgi:hypothetical protein
MPMSYWITVSAETMTELAQVAAAEHVTMGEMACRLIHDEAQRQLAKLARETPPSPGGIFCDDALERELQALRDDFDP